MVPLPAFPWAQERSFSLCCPDHPRLTFLPSRISEYFGSRRLQDQGCLASHRNSTQGTAVKSLPLTSALLLVGG